MHFGLSKVLSCQLGISRYGTFAMRCTNGWPRATQFQITRGPSDFWPGTVFHHPIASLLFSIRLHLRSLLSLGDRSPLSEPLEPLEGVVDENPVLIRGRGRVVTGSGHRASGDLEVDVGKVVEIGRVIYGLHFDGNRSRSGIFYKELISWKDSEFWLSVAQSITLSCQATKYSPLPNVFPVYSMPEERQRLDILDGLDSSVRVVTKPLDRLLGLLRNRHLGWERQRLFPSHNLLVSLLRVLRAERRVSDEHLKHDHAKRPPITRRIISSLERYKR